MASPAPAPAPVRCQRPSNEAFPFPSLSFVGVLFSRVCVWCSYCVTRFKSPLNVLPVCLSLSLCPPCLPFSLVIDSRSCSSSKDSSKAKSLSSSVDMLSELSSAQPCVTRVSHCVARSSSLKTCAASRRCFTFLVFFVFPFFFSNGNTCLSVIHTRGK